MTDMIRSASFRAALPSPSWPSLPSSLWRTLAAIVTLATAIAVWRTATVFSATVDEPAHIAAGVELLSHGTYSYDLQHPPLGRIAAAIGPMARGAHFTGGTGVYEEGAAILGSGDTYVQRLAWARHGEIVFLLILAGAVWLWARQSMPEAGAFAAVLLTVANPNILAHAGLATTDIACAAATTLALYAGVRWLERDDWRHGVWFGAASGLAVASRLSAIGFVALPLCAIWLLRWRSTKRARVSAAPLVAAAAIGLTIVAVVYGFHIDAFITGVRRFVLHGNSGHPTYLLGTPGTRGWWYYYPVALLVKTPSALLLLTIVGSAAAVRAFRAQHDWLAMAPVACAIVILAIGMLVRVDLGVRLVLPMYPLMALAGAAGARALIGATQRVERAFGVVLLIAAAIVPVRAHPDYLAYFNLLAGDHPEHVLVDSNLDWGQDLYRLRDTLRARGVHDSVRVAYFGTSSLPAVVPNSRVLGLHERATGWVAGSETFLAGEWVGGAYAWLLDYPAAARIGPGIRLWYISPDMTHPAAGSTKPTSPH